MEFKDFFSMMKNRISDGADVPYFFRDLMAMITDVTEDEWGTPKDPSTKMTKDNTIRTYAKRGISQKFALSIVYRLSPEMFVESLNERPKATIALLADDYKKYDSSTTAANVANKLAQCFIDIIRTTAGLVPKDEFERQRLMQQAYDLKIRFGDYLRDEADNTCTFPGCGRLLSVAENGVVSYLYEVGLIDKQKEAKVENLLAFCPYCHATYLFDSNKKRCQELAGIKKILVAHNQSMKLLDGMPLEKEIIGVISKIKNLKEKDLLDPSLDPKDIKEKLIPDDNLALYKTVKGYVDTYYVTLKEIIESADKRGEIDYDEVQDQMKAIYKRLKKAKKNNVEIFTEISEKVHKVSLQEDMYCQIVVAYFIAKCEVFDAVSK
ncbi:MAG: HNH endonuclease [Oribacterium sp.]|nr:HNH endonuclease [Oribacterium sp.]